MPRAEVVLCHAVACCICCAGKDVIRGTNAVINVVLVTVLLLAYGLHVSP